MEPKMRFGVPLYPIDNRWPSPLYFEDARPPTFSQSLAGNTGCNMLDDPYTGLAPFCEHCHTNKYVKHFDQGMATSVTDVQCML